MPNSSITSPSTVPDTDTGSRTVADSRSGTADSRSGTADSRSGTADSPDPVDGPKQAPAGAASVAAISTNLNRVVHQITRMKAAIQAAKGNDVDWLPNLLLFHVVASGPMRASALAEHTDVDPSTVSRQIDRLVRTGVIERRADPDDGRACLLAATGVGLGRHARHVARRDAAFDRMLGDWSEGDRIRFADLLERFSTDFDNYKRVMIDDLTGTNPAAGDAREEPK